MALFQLDKESIAARVRNSASTTRIPTLIESIRRGIIGFTFVSLAGFAPWPIFERWFRDLGEVDLYLACVAVFIGLSGIFLHRLIIGPGSLSRFYKLFSLAFVAYATAWTGLWMWLRGDDGVIAGLLGGAAAMGAIFAVGFDAQSLILRVIAALFVLNAAGYYAGSRIAGKLAIDFRATGMLLWGICFGIGLGAGIGVAFYLCQTRVRGRLGVR